MTLDYLLPGFRVGSDSTLDREAAAVAGQKELGWYRVVMGMR